MNQPRERRPELMAPAGGPDAGYAAFHYGADAVYFGLKQFSARAEAANFTPETAGELAAYAHSLTPRRGVYATLNTLVLERELPDLGGRLDLLADLEVDAVIVQDFGVVRLLRRHFPDLRLHASTQLACHNRAGVETLRDWGFSRVTLARELTLEEIRDCSAVPGVETEVFVHGALCYSYSGLCLFSSLALGRSGNRGRCAYLCRDRFEFDSDTSRFPFSMKDLALADLLPELGETGAASFKIEGRMKAPLYVAATTNYYRRALDGSLSPEEKTACEEDIRTIFSRPWTELHMNGSRAADEVDPYYVGHRGVPAGRILALSRRGVCRALRLRLSRDVELHDGLQIEIPGMDQPFGFAVDRLDILEPPPGGDKGSFFEARSGALVEIPLPPDAPEIPDNASVFHSSSQAVKRRYAFDRPKPGKFRIRRPVRARVILAAGRISAELTAPPRSDREEPVSAAAYLDGRFSPAENPARMEFAARGAMEKMGDTPFQAVAITVENSDPVFVPISQLNELRRNAVSRLEAALEAARQRRQDALLADAMSARAPVAPRSPGWSVKVEDAETLNLLEESDWASVEEALVAISGTPLPQLAASLDRLAGRLGRDRIRLALPILARQWEERDLRERIRRLRDLGWTRWEVSNLSGWGFLKTSEGGSVDITADWPLYVTNTQAAREWLDRGASRVTLSPEDGLSNLKPLLAAMADRVTVVVYQDTPLFLSEFCAERALSKTCPGPRCGAFDERDLLSSHGDRVVAVRQACRTILLNREAFSLAGRIPELLDAGATRLRADFQFRKYRAEQVREIWRCCRAGRRPPACHEGNFDRGLM